jgi:hypothetical protein
MGTILFPSQKHTVALIGCKLEMSASVTLVQLVVTATMRSEAFDTSGVARGRAGHWLALGATGGGQKPIRRKQFMWRLAPNSPP